MDTITLDLRPFITTHDEFFEFCGTNPELRIERAASGEIDIMSPAGALTGSRNLSISAQLWLWNVQMKLGIAFDSSAGFILPNGANRSPDASWIRQSRWEALTHDEQVGFAPICPDFVIELRSPSDGLTKLQDKMQEYIANGSRLGWLIDPRRGRVEIYRPSQETEIVYNPASLSGDPELPEFYLELNDIM